MAASLRDQLIGTWRLVSYVERPVDGSAPIHPMGEHPVGIIMYAPDGYMAVQIMRRDRQPFASGDWFRGLPEEYRAEATSYIAYAGPFAVDEERGVLRHTMEVSLFPNWTGQTQPRVVRLEGDTLHLSTETPMPSGGRSVMAYLEWRRAGSGHQRG